MTDEQQQLLKRIRDERPIWRGMGQIAEYMDFLLSLLDSQIKPDCFPDMIAVNKEYAATLMRSACIEKVKEIRRSYHGSADEAVKAHDYSSEHTLLHKATAAREIIAALESVTIQEQK